MNINDLYQKVAEFEDKRTDSFVQKLECKKGCNQCCYTDFSIFETEAENIKIWFESLSLDEKEKLKQKLATTQEDKDGIGPCAFLKDDVCTIYHVRPLICRTQGNAFMLEENGQQNLDICPLNEEAIDQINQSDILNLELLNTILTKMNSAQGFSGKRISLKDLKEFFVMACSRN